MVSSIASLGSHKVLDCSGDQRAGLFWFATPRDSATRREKVQNGPQGRRTSEGVDRLKRAA